MKRKTFFFKVRILLNLKVNIFIRLKFIKFESYYIYKIRNVLNLKVIIFMRLEMYRI